MKPALRSFFIAAALFLALVVAVRFYTGWRAGTALTPGGGTWTALAVDLEHGVFYRPLYGDLGYGGTRYFPLHFVLHAGLMKLGLGPEAAGHTLDAVACLALLFGVYVIFRRLGISRGMAACMALLILAPKVTQIAVLSIRGDILTTSLNVLGIATCMTASIGRRHLLGGALLFTLAFATKPTSLFGLAAVCLSFMFSGYVSDALVLLMATSIGCAGVVGGILLATGDRFIAIMRACATAAGYSLSAGISHLFTLPPLLLPVELTFFVFAFAALVVLPPRKLSGIPALFFICTTLATAVMLGAVGANINHFLDLHVAAVVVIAAWLFDDATLDKNFGIAALTFVTVFASALLLWDIRHQDMSGMDKFNAAYSPGFHAALEFLGPQDRPILADNPLLPILAGQQPYLLDPWMYAALANKNPAFADPMAEAIRGHQFAAVVLEDDLATDPQPPPWRIQEVREIAQYYQLAKCFPRACVYLPRQPQAVIRSLNPSQ